MGVPSWARVGAKVVCVSDFGGSRLWYIPRRRSIYTIADTDPDHQAGPMVELVEITKPMSVYKFPVPCFRPLVDDTADAEIEARIFRSKHHPVSETEAA